LAPVGYYPIVPSLVDPANRQTNYLISLVNGTLSVVARPVIQTATWASNSFTFTWSATSNQMYQVQFRTNLTADAWLNLGSPITAIDSTVTVSESASVPQMFYRVVLYP